MRNELVAYFDIAPDLEYPVTFGNTYILNRNEQIDSFNIVIDGIPERSRLDFNRPYVFVKIVNKDSTGLKWNGNSYIYMLLDTFLEKEVDIVNHIYKYELGLMNCVKLLEKFQTSDLMITHRLKGGSNSIWHYIDAYMKVFSPKVKKTDPTTGHTTWKYDYLLDWSGLNRSPFNNTICADMQINEQTLRNVITTLMLQVGCIPTMNYLSLDFIDLREKPTTFVKYGDIGEIDSSGASDSYANTLVSSPSQVLDSENFVVTDCIGFRDSKQALLKQEENLKLETRFPIYHIEKVWMHKGTDILVLADSKQFDGTSLQPDKITLWPVLGTARGHGTYAFINSWERNPNPFILLSERKIKLNFVYPYAHDGRATADPTIKAHKCTLGNIKIHFTKYDSSSQKYQEKLVLSYPNDDDIFWLLNLNDNTSAMDADFDIGGTGRSFAQELKPDGTKGTLIDSADDNTNDYLQNLVYGDNDNGCFCYYTYISFTAEQEALINDSEFAWIEYRIWDQKEDKGYHCSVPFCNIYDIMNGSDVVNKSLISLCFAEKSFRSEILSNGLAAYTNPSTTGGYPLVSVPMKAIRPVSGGYGVDVTDLFVENSKRQLLETNYLEMQEETTIAGLAKYYYGTVKYDIGGKEITGFSDKYSWSVGWWNQSRTYFDNILQVIKDNGLEKVDYEDLPVSLVNSYENYTTIPLFEDNLAPLSVSDITTSNKGEFLFNIKYQPINSYKKKYVKEQDNDIIFPIEQLNNTENGLSDSNRLGKNMQDTINRIGNVVKTVNQTTSDLSHINPVNSLIDDKYLVFQRAISIFEDYLAIQYVASEKYVMQNYFTSIITKYRAYEYVDYSQSVVRKENTTVYCMLSSTKYYHGCDNVIFVAREDIFLSGATIYDLSNGAEKSVKYLIEKSKNEDLETEAIKNEVSVLVDNNSFSIISQDYDNVSAGQYLVATTVDPALGGTAQKWQMWNQNEFNERHYMYYVCDLGENVLMTEQNIEDYSNLLDALELVDMIPVATRPAYIEALEQAIAAASAEGIYDVKNYPIVSSNYETYSIFILRSAFDGYKYYYKDDAEIINQTVTFMFYSPENDIKITKNFLKHCKLVNQIDLNPNYIIGSDNLDLTDELKQMNGRTLISQDISTYIKTGYSDNFAYIDVDWSLLTNYNNVILSFMEIRSSNQYYSDFIGFSRNGKTQSTRYYLSFNDSKTDNALIPSDSGLFDKVEVKNGWNRTV